MFNDLLLNNIAVGAALAFVGVGACRIAGKNKVWLRYK